MPAHRKDTPSTGAPAVCPEPPPRGALLDRLPFRRKLDILVFVPVLVIAAMLTFLAYQQITQARWAAGTARLVRSSEQVAKLIDDLQTEHRQALLVSLRYEAMGPNVTQAPDTAPYLTAQRTVNLQVETVRGAFGNRLPGPEAQALKGIEGLDSLRSSIEQGPIPADNIDPAYSGAVDDLINGLGINGADPDNMTDRTTATTGGSGSAAPDPGAGVVGAFPLFTTDEPAPLTGTPATLLDALLRADTAHATFETSVFAARTGDTNAFIEFTGAVGAHDQYAYQADRFRRHASAAQGEELAGVERTAFQSVIAEHYATLRVDPSGLVAERPEQVHAALDESLRDVSTYEHQAQHRLAVTRSLIGKIAAQTQQASQDAWWRAGALLLAAVLAFAAWLLFSVLARRSVLRAVRALTGAARRVAEAAGEELARVADDDAEDTGPPRLAAVPVPVRDEIGELAEAFNQVQVTATALLERQVLSRRNFAEMFGNIGRRVSNLTAGQLSLIDAVERGETDPEVLERLYRIDHIAVRLQRNADSLMLLAGLRETGTDPGPVRLSNVVRAALGQIEAYQRVTPRADGDVSITPDVVGDLTLMLAELLENAVTFSPASSRVEVLLRPGDAGRAGGGEGGAEADEDVAEPWSGVSRRLVTDGAVVEIVDHGLGMGPERLAEENARLVRRERLDLVPTKVLGLFVVGSLSRRWGIQVTLSRTRGGGVTATVIVPPQHLLPAGAAEAVPARPAPGRRPSGPAGRRPGTEQPPAGRAGLPRRVPAPRAAPGSGQDGASGSARGGTPGAGRGGTSRSGAGHGGTPGATGSVPDDPFFLGGPPASGSRGAGGRPPADVAPVSADDPLFPDGPLFADDASFIDGSSVRRGPVPHDGPSPAAGTVPAGRPVDVEQAGPAPTRGGLTRRTRARGAHGGRTAQDGRQDGPPYGPGAGASGGRAPVPGEQSPRPLRRRVRGATLSATTASSVLPPRPSTQTPPGWRPVDPDAARRELEEFEAAVERAQRDSARHRGAHYLRERLTGTQEPQPPQGSQASDRPSAPQYASPPHPGGRRSTGTEQSSSSEGVGQ